MREKLILLLLLLLQICSSLGFPGSELSGTDLLELTPDLDEETELACRGPEVITCNVARVNWEVIMKKENILLPTGDLLMFRFVLKQHNTSMGQSDHTDLSLVYEGEAGAEGVLTYTKETGAVYGTFEVGGLTYKMESLEDLTHVVWVQIDQSVFQDIEPRLEEAETELVPDMRQQELEARGKVDTNTIVEFSITVYYTEEFKKTTADPLTFIDQVIAETNQGYINSGIPIRARLHCVIQSDIRDGLPAHITLAAFKQSQRSLTALRRSADAAILLVNSFSNSGVCGVNYFNTIRSGNTLGTVRKGCALGYYSFGHELAHGFGLAHDRRVAAESSQNYAFGFVFQPRLYRTIMAYSTAGEKRVNYYSSPAVTYLGSVTGNRLNDNARTLTEVRFSAAGVGDESQSCPGEVVEECGDKYPNCGQVALTSCWHTTVKEACRQSCGLCPGLTPATSNTCYNKYSNCDQLARLGFCSNKKVAAGCRFVCGAC